MQSELTRLAHVMDGLRKAGLGIPDELAASHDAV